MPRLAIYWDRCARPRHVYCCTSSSSYPRNANVSCFDDRTKKNGWRFLKIFELKKSCLLEVGWGRSQLLTLTVSSHSVTWVQQKRSRQIYILLLQKTLTNMVLFNKLWAHREKPPQCTHWFFFLIKENTDLIQWWLTVIWQMMRYLSAVFRYRHRCTVCSNHQGCDRIFSWTDRSPAGICKWDNTAVGGTRQRDLSP